MEFRLGWQLFSDHAYITTLEVIPNINYEKRFSFVFFFPKNTASALYMESTEENIPYMGSNGLDPWSKFRKKASTCPPIHCDNKRIVSLYHIMIFFSVFLLHLYHTTTYSSNCHSSLKLFWLSMFFVYKYILVIQIVTSVIVFVILSTCTISLNEIWVIIRTSHSKNAMFPSETKILLILRMRAYN